MQPESQANQGQHICGSNELMEKSYLTFPVIYRKQENSGLIIRYEGQVYGYLNLCAHMPRRLDCECEDVFDEAGEKLRCSMHGITYDPVSGEALSEICLGQKLTRLAVAEEGGVIRLTEKRASLVSETDQTL